MLQARPLSANDVVVEVDGVPVGDLGDLYRQIWSAGEAGVTVNLGLLRDGERHSGKVRTCDRSAMLKQPRRH